MRGDRRSCLYKFVLFNLIEKKKTKIQKKYVYDGV